MPEVVRRLDEISRRLDKLADTLEARYVPRGEYVANESKTDLRIKELEEKGDRLEAFKRQVMAGVMIAVIGAFIVAVLARAGIPGG